MFTVLNDQWRTISWYVHIRHWSFYQTQLIHSFLLLEHDIKVQSHFLVQVNLSSLTSQPGDPLIIFGVMVMLLSTGACHSGHWPWKSSTDNALKAGGVLTASSGRGSPACPFLGQNLNLITKYLWVKVPLVPPMPCSGSEAATCRGTVALRGLGRRLLLPSRSPVPAPDIVTLGSSYSAKRVQNTRG